MNPPNHDHDSIETEFRILNATIATKSPHQTDIELITIQPNAYTSLRDIIAASSAVGGASSPASPTCRKSGGCEDVTIRNRLVKQAAMAYLQPLSSPRPGIGDRSWPERVKANLNSCFSGDEDDELGCIAPIDGVVLKPIKELWGRIVRAFEDHRD